MTRIWIAAGAMLVLMLGLWWPGTLTPDSALQLSQARSGLFTNHHPPLMAALWRCLLWLSDGPPPMLLWNCASMLGGLALIAVWARRRYGRETWGLLLLPLLPWVGVPLGVVGKDAALCGLLTLALGLSLSLHGRAANLALIVAGGLRHNAASAVWPLLAGVWRRGVWGAAAALLVALALGSFWSRGLRLLVPVEESRIEDTLYFFDIAAVSLSSGVDYSGLGLDATGRARLADCYYPMNADKLEFHDCAPYFERFRAQSDTGRLWRNAIAARPLEYANTGWRTFGNFCGWTCVFGRRCCWPTRRRNMAGSPSGAWPGTCSSGPAGG